MFYQTSSSQKKDTEQNEQNRQIKTGGKSPDFNLFIANIPDTYAKSETVINIIEKILKLGTVKQIQIKPDQSVYYIAYVNIEWFNSMDNTYIKAILSSRGKWDSWGDAINPFKDSNGKQTYFRFMNIDAFF